MARRSSNTNKQTVNDLIRVFLRLPPGVRLVIVLVALVAGVVYLTGLFRPGGRPSVDRQVVADGENEFLLCFWNVENLFDDRDDKRNSIDEQYDNPFANDQRLRDLKYDRIATALLRMNNGNGPDVIACVEVESVRAGELLQEVLNRKLAQANKDDKFRYRYLAMKNLAGGRHIAPCVISRLAVDPSHTRLIRSRLRILETRLSVNGHDLCLVASHWTSQLRQRDGSDGDSGRENYADSISERFRELVVADGNTDVLVCGDFNDTPDADPVVRNLRAIGDRSKVLPTSVEPYLYNLMSGKNPTDYGTLWYNSRPLIYDQICVSPGMLDDQGWSVVQDSVVTLTQDLTRAGATRREPWRFGDPDRPIRDADRGYADHFPVAVKIKVQLPKE